MDKLSVTSKDYQAIYEDLVKAIPEVTKIWNSNTETDPGLVLVKLESMLGDMLNYNRDKAVLEIYPETVQQRKNAAQIFGLMGYKMRWYRSARCITYLTNNSSDAISIPRYTKFVTRGDEIQYTNLDQIEIGAGQTVETTLYQGIPKIPSKVSEDLISKGNEDWHSIYNFNVFASDIVDNRIYIRDSNIDESTIVLIDNTGDTWIQTENVSAETATNKYYELKVDNKDRPYIKLVSYWGTFKNVEKFKLFYLYTSGENGEISENTIGSIRSGIVDSDGILTDPAYITIQNNESTDGYNPETPDEAREESQKYINTFNTLVTLDDFTKFVKRLNGVANCIVTDFTTDPYKASSSGYSPLVKYEVKVYVVRKENYLDVERSIYKNYIANEIESVKTYPLTVRVVVDDEIDGETEPATVFYDWDVSGTIYTKEPVSMDRAKEILVNINNALNSIYALENVEFNETLKYTDVVNSIIKSDEIISYVDLDPINYYTDISDQTTLIENPKEVISGRYSKNILCYEEGLPEYNPSTPTVDGVILWMDRNERYILHVSNVPVKPGSLCIRLENNEYVIVDDKNGKLVSTSSILNEGTVDYDTGTIDMKLNGRLYTSIMMSYQKNKIGIVDFYGVDSTKLTVDVDSLKK